MEVSRDIDAIDNLNTAKMTLRWALERLRTLETGNAEMRRQLDERRADLSARTSLSKEREAYAASRETYYEKLEPIVSEFCKGRLDIKKLLEREVEAARREAALLARQQELEKDYSSRRDVLERKFKRLQADLEARDKQKSGEADRALSEHRKEMEQSYICRELSLRAAEHRVSVQEKSLTQAREKLEAEYAERREDHRRDARRVVEEYQILKEDVFQEARRRQEDQDRQRAERDKAWTREREQLLASVLRWEKQAQAYLDHITVIETEKMGESRKHMAAMRTMGEQLESMNKEYGIQERTLEAHRRTIEEILKRRQSDLDKLENALINRFEAVEAHARNRDAAWTRREADLRRRDRNWRGHLLDQQESAARTSGQIEELKRELISTIRSYKKKLAEPPPAENPGEGKKGAKGRSNE